MRLSRGAVLTRALALLDEVGLEALTMRRLAAALGVQAGAIYWHFANKQELHDAMAEEMMKGLLEPQLRGAWHEQLAELARRLRLALARHRDGARLAAEALKPGPHGLAVSERMLRIIRQGGMSQRLSLWAAAVLGYYVLGFIIDTQAGEAARTHGLDDLVQSFKQQLDPKRYPHLLAISDETIVELTGERDAEARFEFGLQVIMSGLRATARARRVRPVRARKRRAR